MNKILLAIMLIGSLTACQSAYYSTMEKFGIHKREILVDKVSDARDAQKDGQKEFKSALAQFKALTSFDGGNLEKTYNKLNTHYESSIDAANKIKARIDDVESVSKALFEEWEQELSRYSNGQLRQNSQQQLKQTKNNYQNLISAMRSAESRLSPVLEKMEDHVLYLKHNLNARAISGLKSEEATIDRQVNDLIKALEKSIIESERFIKDMK